MHEERAMSSPAHAAFLDTVSEAIERYTTAGAPANALVEAVGRMGAWVLAFVIREGHVPQGAGRACIAEYLENTERSTLEMLHDEGYDIDARAG
jgi:hypothetical protein